MLMLVIVSLPVIPPSHSSIRSTHMHTQNHSQTDLWMCDGKSSEQVCEGSQVGAVL